MVKISTTKNAPSPNISRLVLQYWPVERLIPHPDNPRQHTKRHIRQVADSIRQFGFRVPLLVDGNHRLIAGHGRLEACKLLDIKEVPVIEATDLSEAQIRALMIADNKLTEITGWDEDLLSQNFKILADLDLDFDLEITGFDYGDIERLMILGEKSNETPEEAVDINNVPAVTQAGDLWQLGDHRVLCADSTQSPSYTLLLGDNKAQLIFTDPPYNLPAKTIGKVCAKQHGDFANASGEMSSAEFTQFLSMVFSHLCDFSVSGSIHYLFIDWRHLKEMLAAGENNYTELKNICVWAKDRVGMGTFYRSQHELVMVYKNGNAQHKNHFQLGQHGRLRSNVWQFPSVRSANDDAGDAGDKHDREALQLHPTIKPVRLIEEALLDCSRRKDLVLDPFLGSGSTLIACEKTHRRCFGIECAPRYVDVTLYRWHQFTGKEPIHFKSGLTYSKQIKKLNKSGVSSHGK